MKAYTFHRGRISEGIATTVYERFGAVVALGEAGRGRHLEIVGLDRRNTPLVEEGRVLSAAPKTISPRHGGRKFTVLTAAPDEACAYLVRVSTQWTYTQGTHGYVTTWAGAPERHARGLGAHGIAGSAGSWDESLWVLRPGDDILVEPEGGRRKSEPYRIWVEMDGSLQCDTDRNREMDLAMRGE